MEIYFTLGPTCYYGGQTYQSGDTFPNVDGCNRCLCNENGTVACTDTNCCKYLYKLF